MSGKRVRVIVVTDGDEMAREAIEIATKNINGRCISLSAARSSENATQTPAELINLVLSAEHDPVVVMVDDTGEDGEGCGEKALRALVNHADVNVIGVVAVASNTPNGPGVEVSASVSREGSVIAGPVDKKGRPLRVGKLHGDTVGILRNMNIPIIIGLGDPGKMDYADEASKGAPITTKALQTVLEQADKQAETAPVGT
jgi:stage V sporulation protein AE